MVTDPNLVTRLTMFLVNKRFYTSVLDTPVYRSTLHKSDHKLIVSSLHFKINVKRRHTGNIFLDYWTTNISSTCSAGYPSALADVFSEFNQSSSANTLWDTSNLLSIRLVSFYLSLLDQNIWTGSLMRCATCHTRKKR